MTQKSKKKLKKILLVEDDPMVQKAIQISLVTIGDFHVDACSRGEEALKYLRVKKPDLILLDYKLPDMDGIAFFDILKEDESGASIPVIFISGSVMPDHIKAYEEAGAIGVIPKPFDARTLSGVIEKIYNQRPG